MREAKARGSDIVVFPELALTTFFPRWWMDDQARTRRLSNAKCRARRRGRCSKPPNRSASASISATPSSATRTAAPAAATTPRSWWARQCRIVGKYRKVHLPGHADDRAGFPFQHLEKRYFEVWRLGLSGLARIRAPVSACVFATIAAGPRPIASWACRASSSCFSATTRRPIFHGYRSRIPGRHVSQSPVRPGRRLSERHVGDRGRQGRRGGRGVHSLPAAASSSRPARSWPRRRARTMRSSSPTAISTSARFKRSGIHLRPAPPRRALRLITERTGAIPPD